MLELYLCGYEKAAFPIFLSVVINLYYFNSKWYKKSRCVGICTGITLCTEEEAASAKYYEELLAKFTEEIRFECEQIKNTSLDVFAEDRTESKDKLEEEFADWKKSHNPEEAAFYAAKELSERIQKLKLILPENILSRIPDIRIFALKKADENTLDMLNCYADECRNYVNEVNFAFENEYYEKTDSIPDEIWEEYGFEGGIIKKIITKDNNISFYLDNSQNTSFVTAFHLINAEVVRMDDNLENSEWIYNELYKHGKIYEAHAICKNNTNLPEFIIKSEDIAFDFDK